MDYSKRVPVPTDGSINGGLSPTGSSLKNIYGTPGPLTVNCSPVTNQRLKADFVTADVGPFKVTGLKPAVQALARAFAKVKVEKLELYDQIKTAGMVCCRLIRGSQSSYSIHSWGGAIDLYCGESVVPLGSTLTNLGVLELYPYLHNEGFYWGAEFSRVDAMHFEVAAETVAKWKAAGLL